MAIVRPRRKPAKLSPDQIIAAHTPEEIKWHQTFARDKIKFCQLALNFDPHIRQREYLTYDVRHERCATLFWGRQQGKSTAVGLDLVHLLAFTPGSKAYIFTPSYYQSYQLWKKVVDWFAHTDYLSTYCPSRTADTTLTVNPGPNESTLELVKIGADGSLGRSRTSPGPGKCILVFDEMTSFNNPGKILTALRAIRTVGGGIVLASSPDYEGSYCHKLVQTFKEYQKTDPAYKVIDCEWHETKHVSEAYVLAEKKFYEGTDNFFGYETEVLGRFSTPQGSWFSTKLIDHCKVDDLPEGGPNDTWIYSVDSGGRSANGKSVFCVVISRLNQLLNRLEISDVRMFRMCLEDFKYRLDAQGGEEVATSYSQILNVIRELNETKPCSWLGYDSNTERSFSELLEAQGFPVKNISISSYNQKLDGLEALRRTLFEQKIVFPRNSPIARQLAAFAPVRDDQSTRWQFPSANYDLISCCIFLQHYLAQKYTLPFVCSLGPVKKPGALW